MAPSPYHVAMRVGIIISCLHVNAGSAFAQAAPPVTGLKAVQHDGQTFIRWMDPAAGANGCRYKNPAIYCLVAWQK